MSFKQKKIIIFLTLFLAAGFLLVGDLALAQQAPDLGNQYAGQIGLGGQDIRTTIASIIRTALGLLGIVVVALMIYAGFLWMTAGGNEDRVIQAKKILFNSVIGLVIILSAYAITSFIISKLTSATQAVPAHCSNGQMDQDLEETGVDCGGECLACGGGCPDCYFPSNVFFINSLFNGGNVCVRNFRPTITFSKDVKIDTLGNDIFTIVKKSDNSRVGGAWQLARDKNDQEIKNIIIFVPDGDCGNGQKGCFEPHSTSTLIIDKAEASAVESIDGLHLSCNFNGDRCRSVEFVPGENIDELPPVITINSPEGDVEAGKTVPVQVAFRDDNGVQNISVYENDRYVGSANPAQNCQKEGTVEIVWPTVGLASGQHVLLAQGLDWAGRSGSDSKNISLRPNHCYDDKLDLGEELAGPPACGGECGVCGGGHCNDNSQCASGFCENGTCVDRMKILGFGPRSGAPGTFVTIVGYYFGGQAGKVYFTNTDKPQPDVNNDADWIEADLADCEVAAMWTNRQITVKVPTTTTDGPIKVVTKAADNKTFTDTTNDNWGPNIGIFDVNDEVHPKLCQVAPDHGVVGDAVTLTGRDWGGVYDAQNDKVLFGETVTLMVPDNWKADNIKTTVPTGLNTGSFAVKVVTRIAGRLQESNSLLFRAEAGINKDLPFIDSVSPDRGGEGEYLTIAGQNFGTNKGVIWFKLNGQEEAVPGSFVFPADCEGQLWSNERILVKFPSGAPQGNYSVQVATDNGPVSPLYNYFKFLGEQAAPGICKISPASGPIPLPPDAKVEITGEYFQSELWAPANGLVFYHTFDTFDVVNGTSYDRSGSGYNGLVNNNATIEAGRIGQAISFTRGTGGHVLFGLPAINNLEFPNKDFAVSLWYKSNFTQANANANIIARGCRNLNPNPNPGIVCGFWKFKKFRVGGGGIQFQLGDGNNDHIKNALMGVHGINVLDNNWHNLVGVMDRVNKQVRTYVDGRLGATVDIAMVGDINTSIDRPTFSINDSAPTNDESMVDDVRIYSRALSAEEISDVYLIGSGQKPRIVDGQNPEVYFSKTGSSARDVATMSLAAFDSLVGLNPGQKVLARPANNTISGAVLVRRPGDQKVSNALRFDVFNCTRNDNKCTDEGLKCCGDGTCRDRCADEKLTAGYIWRFSTKEIPSLPRVVEECSEEVLSIPSPAPSTIWNTADNTDQEKVCRSALVTIKFNTLLDPEKIADHLIIRKCGGVEENKCTGQAASVVSETVKLKYVLAPVSADQAGQRDYLTIFLTDANDNPINWDIDSWYQVVLTSGIVSAGPAGLALAASRPCDDVDNSAYCFVFKTDDKDCVLKEVLVTPERFWTNQLTGPNAPIQYLRRGTLVDLEYEGLGLSAERCITMDPARSGYRWEWSSANVSYSDIFGDLRNTTTTKATALSNTVGEADLPQGNVNITAVARKPGLLSKTGYSPLTIDMSNPEVVDHWPDCSQSCLNTEVGVKFNIGISNRNLFGNLPAQNGAVQLLKCFDDNCVNTASVLNPGDVYFEETSGRAILKIANSRDVSLLLEGDTTYKVIISAPDNEPNRQIWSMKSFGSPDLSNKPLSGEFTWAFHTKKESCKVNKVEVTPKEYISRQLRDRTVFGAAPYSAPDQCDAKGQKLNARSYDWSWGARDEVVTEGAGDTSLVADITVFKTADNSNPHCTAYCTRKGSDIPASGMTAVCGNEVWEAGEDCDPPNKNTGCSLNCLRIGNAATSTCGNNIVEPDLGEECDPPNQTLGCSERCLNLGSKPVGGILAPNASICDNGRLTLGEDCDTGIAPLISATSSAMGCTADCLHAGARLSKAWCERPVGEHGGYDEYSAFCAGSLSQCGNRALELDEDQGCDGPAGRDEQLCNEFCLKKDDGCQPGAEGCSSRGTYLGSSLFYAFPSVCGDAFTGIGEESFCEESGGLIFTGDRRSSDPLALVIGEGRGRVNAEEPPKQVSIVTASTQGDLLVNRGLAAGSGKFVIPCGHTTDQECRDATGNPDSVVGANSCCYTRPRLVSVYPATTTPPNILDDICPNTYLEAAFDQPIDEKTLPGNFIIARGKIPHEDKILTLSGIRDLRVRGNRAYAVGNNKFYIIDVTAPWNPQTIKEVALNAFGGGLAGAGALEVDGINHLAYVVGSKYLLILNIAEENNIRRVAILRQSEGRPGIDGEAALHYQPFAIARGRNTGFPGKEFVYIISREEDAGGYVEVIDVTEPAVPKHFAYWHKNISNQEIINSHLGRLGLWEIQTAGNYIFTTTINSRGPSVDVLAMNPADNTIASIKQLSLEDPAGLAVDGSYLYVVSEKQKFNVFDVRNPEDPRLLSSVDLEEAGANNFTTDNYHASRILISGHYAYVAMESFRNVVEVDISSPAQPVVVGRLAVNSSALGVERVGDYLLINEGAHLRQIAEAGEEQAGGQQLDFVNIQRFICRGAEDVTSLIAMVDWPEQKNWYARIWSEVVAFFKNLFLDETAATSRQAQSLKWCAGDDLGVAKVVNDPVRKVSRITVDLDGALASDTEYAIILKDGIRDRRGISIGRGANGKAINWKFATVSEICAVDKIEVSPAEYLFRKANLTIDLQAEVRARNGQFIQPTTVYNWDYVWSPRDNGIVSWAVTTSSINRVKSEPREGEVRVRVSADVKPNTVGQPIGRVATAESHLTVNLCENPWPPVDLPIGGALQNIFPYEDRTGNNDNFDLTSKSFDSAPTTNARGYYNFSTSYCASSGVAGATFDDLPYLRPAIQTDANSLQGALKRFILTNDKNTDAIGVQIFPNLEHKTIREWYASQNLGGNPQPIRAAGYDALGDNNNIYVDALNFVTSTAGGNYTENLYTNVYLFSINADAKPETRQVFELLIKNLQFNINLTNKKYCSGNSEISCQTDFDCPSGQSCLADIDRMIRNVQRLHGLQSIKSRLAAYNEAEHPTDYPDLKEGTFLPGQSISTWPSWGAALSNAAGSGLPVDPINRLGSAGTCAATAGANTYCLNDRYCLGFAPTSTCSMHDPQTGWSVYERRFSFACSTSSYAYRYIYSTSSPGYTVRARMETTEAISQPSWQNFADDFVDFGHFKLFEQNGICNAGGAQAPNEISTIATGGTCGDRVVQVGKEACDPPGSERFESCRKACRGDAAKSCTDSTAIGGCFIVSRDLSINNVGPCIDEIPVLTCNNSCHWAPSSTPANSGFSPHYVSCSYGSKCGNGKLEPGEECDLGGNLNGKVGSTCDIICHSAEDYCGNGNVDEDLSKELCDWNARTPGNFVRQEGLCANVVGSGKVCSTDDNCHTCSHNSSVFCTAASARVDCPLLATGFCELDHNVTCSDDSACKVCNASPNIPCTADVQCPILPTGHCSLNNGVECSDVNPSCKVCEHDLSRPCTAPAGCGLLAGTCSRGGASCTQVADCGVCTHNHAAACKVAGDCPPLPGRCNNDVNRVCNANADCSKICATSKSNCITYNDCPIAINGFCSNTSAICTAAKPCPAVKRCSGVLGQSCDAVHICPLGQNCVNVNNCIFKERCIADKCNIPQDTCEVLTAINSCINRPRDNCITNNGANSCNKPHDSCVPNAQTNACDKSDTCSQPPAGSCHQSPLYVRNNPFTLIDLDLRERYGRAKSDSCSWDCQNYGPYCGDEKVQPEFGETCDKNADKSCTVNGVQGQFLCDSNCQKQNKTAMTWWRLEKADSSQGNLSFPNENGFYFQLWCVNVGNASTITCPSVVTDGKYGRAVHFDGYNDYLRVNTVAGNLMHPGFSVEMWVNPDNNVNPGAFLLKKGIVGGYYLNLDGQKRVIFSVESAREKEVGAFIPHFDPLGGGGAQDGGLSLVDITTAEAKSTSPLPSGQWTHVVGTYDRDGDQIARLYVNGSLVDSADRAVAMTTNVENFIIGSNDGLNDNPIRFKGKIDELAYYKHALLPAEIQYLYEKGMACSTTVPLASDQEPFDPNKPGCGNGKIEENEACDRGAANGIACSASYNHACNYCSADCKNVIEVQPAEYCGDGKIQANKGELCEIDPVDKTLWSSTAGGVAEGGQINTGHSGWSVLTCEAAVNAPGEFGVYSRGTRSCVDNCTRLQDDCIKCGLIPVNDPSFPDGVTVENGRVINILDPASHDPFPNGNLALFPNRAMVGGEAAGICIGACVTSTYSLLNPYFGAGDPLYPRTSTLSAIPVCSEGGDLSYKLQVNLDSTHLFDFPILVTPALGQYDLVLSPVMNSRDDNQKKHIRVVAVWYGKAGMGMDSPDSSGFVVNAPDNQRTVFEAASFRPKVTGSNYFIVSTTPSHSIWYHGESEIGNTFTESYTIDTAQMDTENYAFYVRTGQPISNYNGYLKVQVYFPENDRTAGHVATSTVYYLRNAQASDNAEATYWHVFNIRQAANLPNIRDRFVEINAKRTSPQYFDFSL